MINNENDNFIKVTESREDQVTEFKIIWGDRYLMIKGKNYDTGFHRHHALQISISLDNSIGISRTY